MFSVVPNIGNRTIAEVHQPASLGYLERLGNAELLGCAAEYMDRTTQPVRDRETLYRLIVRWVGAAEL